MTLKYSHLVGLPFVFGEQDCYTTLQRFYADNFDITFPNYARPNDFWRYGMDMYRDRYVKHGFYVLDCHPSEYRPGDVFLMAIGSSVGNHTGILVDGGKMLHHLWGRLSAVDPYRDLYRNSTIGVFRHRDVVLEMQEETTNITEYLSTRMQAKLNDLRGTS